MGVPDHKKIMASPFNILFMDKQVNVKWVENRFNIL